MQIPLIKARVLVLSAILSSPIVVNADNDAQQALKRIVSSDQPSGAQSSQSVEDAKIEEEKPDNLLTITTSSRGLIAYVSAAGSKDDIPVIEAPMSISVLTEERIKDIGAKTIQDALGYVAGVYNGPYGSDSRGDWSVIRGVDPVLYLDGMKMLYGYYNNTRPNPYGLSQIEILKGPASVLYGQGSTGGIVNLVSKKPQAESQGEIWAQVGSFDRQQIAMDYTGAFNQDASLLYRVNVLYRDSEYQTDYVDDNSLYFAPALTWFVGDATELTLLANVQRNETGSSTQFFPHVGTVREAPFGQIPVNRFISEPGYDGYDTEQDALTVLFEHEINDTWSVKASSRYMDSSSEYRTMYAYPFNLQADHRNLLRSVSVSDADVTSITGDVRLHAKFDWGIASHSIVIGYDFQDVETNKQSFFGSGMGGLLDVYSPQYGATPLPDPDALLANRNINRVYIDQAGLYFQDQIKIDEQWIISLGARADKAKSVAATHNAAGEFLNNNEQWDENETTTRVGLLYIFDNGLSPYVSYSESFEPMAGSTSDGNPLKPHRGEQNEIGVKFQPQGSEHLITASYFDITEKNRLIPTPTIEDPLANAQSGKAEINGIEVEAQLEWDTIDIYANYTHNDAKDESKQPINSIPEQMISGWITYRPESFLPGFKVGLGTRYVGETSFLTMIDEQSERYHTPDYTMVDLMLGYEIGQFDFMINVDNLTDKTVVTTCLDRGDCFYGQQRTVTANLRYQF